MRHLPLIPAAVALLILLAACSQPEPQKPAAKPGPAWPGKMTLVTEPDPPLSNKPVKFRLKLSDEASKPVRGAQVKASLTMPLMDMGKNEVTLAEKGDGDYEGSGKFTMVGPWNVLVIAIAGGKTGEQRFDLAVRE